MAKAGADAVKVQTYKPSSLTLNLDTGYFAKRKDGIWKGFTPWNLFAKAALPYQWHEKLKQVSDEERMTFFSSPFDKQGVDFLESMNVPMYKIASFEITDTPLISYTASKGKPMIISTGVAEIEDIELAIKTCRDAGNNDITLLKCTSQYPATIDQANLNTIPDMKNRFGVKVGVSDHTMGSIVPVVAVSLGATVVEKHFTLDRSMGGPDAGFSMEPHEFREMVDNVRVAESALGKVSYEVTENDKNRRRSLFVVEDIKAGDVLTKHNIRSIRPGFGLHPKLINEIMGSRAAKDLIKGDALSRLDYE